MSLNKYTNIHYAWVVLAVTFICLLVSAAIRSVPGIIILSLEQEFNWSREIISGTFSVNLILSGLAGPFLGRQMDLHGTKVIILLMILLLILGVSGSTFMTEAWELYLLWGVIIGIGSGGLSIVLGSCIINQWFNQHRGLAMGIIGAAFSSGQLIFTPIIMGLNIQYGWRAVLLFIVLLFSCVVLPLVLWLMVDNPEKKGLQAYGKELTKTSVSPSLNPMHKVIGNSQFWLLALSFGICGFTTTGLFQLHYIPYGIENGFSQMTMALSLGVMGVADIIGTIASGWVCDCFGKRRPLAIYYFLRGLSLIFLPYVVSVEYLMLFSVIYGLNWLSTVPATSNITTDLFGKQNVGVVFGWILFIHQLGAALGSFTAGYMYSITGSYVIVFMISGLFAIIATGLVLRIR